MKANYSKYKNLIRPAEVAKDSDPQEYMQSSSRKMSMNSNTSNRRLKNMATKSESYPVKNRSKSSSTYSNKWKMSLQSTLKKFGPRNLSITTTLTQEITLPSK